MKCDSPISIKNPRLGNNNAAERITVPCGKCVACLMSKRVEWVTRLNFQLKESLTGIFLTLTYAPEFLPEGGLSKEDVQKFFKRLRSNTKLNFKYYAVGEYGTKFKRPHYHILLFGVSKKDIWKIENAWSKEIDGERKLMGRVHFGDLNEKTMYYTLNYMLKDEKKNSELKGFSLISKGIGKNYLDLRSKWHKDDISRNYVVKEGGLKSRLPRYYRNKIYSAKERELQNIRERERVDSEKINPEDFKVEIDIKENRKRRMLKNLKTNAKF